MITHIKDPNSDKCIVFIHGLGGGPGTFNKFTLYLETKWNIDYGIIVYYFTYYKNIFTSKFLSIIPSFLLFTIKAFWSKRNTDNANKLKLYIENNCIENKNIILVAHSMGGLVARQFLVECKRSQIDIRHIKMLCTYATPHNGSHLAKYASIVRLFYLFRKPYDYLSTKINYRICPQIGDLSNLNEFITKLNKDWRDFNVEKDLKFIRIGGTKDWLVKTNSSNLHNDDLNNVFYYEFGHSQLISPLVNIETFSPIDKFLEKLNQLEIQEEYFEELEEEINYDDEEY